MEQETAAAPATSEVPTTPQAPVVPPPVAPPPVAPPPVAAPKSHALLGFVIVILALGALGVGGYFGYRYYLANFPKTATTPSSEETTPEASPAAETEESVPDETADWQTYENATYKFSFKYPKNFKLAEVAKTIKESLITEALAFKVTLTQDIYVAQAQNPQITVEVAQTTRTLDEVLVQLKAKVKELAEGVSPESPYYGQAQAQIKSSEMVAVGDFTALKLDRYGGPGAPNPNYWEYYVKTPGGYLLVFSARYGVDASGSESIEKTILSQLITTLKFLE